VSDVDGVHITGTGDSARVVCVASSDGTISPPTSSSNPEAYCEMSMMPEGSDDGKATMASHTMAAQCSAPPGIWATSAMAASTTVLPQERPMDTGGLQARSGNVYPPRAWSVNNDWQAGRYACGFGEILTHHGVSGYAEATDGNSDCPAAGTVPVAVTADERVVLQRVLGVTFSVAATTLGGQSIVLDGLTASDSVSSVASTVCKAVGLAEDQECRLQLLCGSRELLPPLAAQTLKDAGIAPDTALTIVIRPRAKYD